MRYQVRIGGRCYDIEVDEGRVEVEGELHEAELRPVESTPLRLLVLDHRSFALSMETPGQGKWALHHLGEGLEVEVIDERTAHIRNLGGTGKAHPAPPSLRAPMPGLVVRLLVEPGQAVAAGEGLVVLEAMKMENELKAISAAVIERVEVAPGQAVERGATLIVFRGE